MTTTERIQWLQSLPAETISPRQLADVLGGEPYQYNLSAQIGKLTLPHIWRGRNLRILKQPVIKLLSEGVTQSWPAYTAPLPATSHGNA